MMFDVDLASIEEIGVNGAIILNQVKYWCDYYKQQYEQTQDKAIKEKHFHNGYWFVYNTVDDWQKQFCFISSATFRRTVDKLIKADCLIVAEYNKAYFDHTKWYSVNEKVLETLKNQRIAQNEQIEFIKLSKSNSQNEQIELVNVSNPTKEYNTKNTNTKNKGYIYTQPTDKDNSAEKIIFTEPTLEDVKLYCAEIDKKMSVEDMENFIEFYSAKGWTYGRYNRKMKNANDWHKSIKLWKCGNKTSNKTKTEKYLNALLNS